MIKTIGRWPEVDCKLLPRIAERREDKPSWLVEWLDGLIKRGVWYIVMLVIALIWLCLVIFLPAK